MWLTELTSEPAADYPAFAAPLMFIYALGRDGAIIALRQRAALCWGTRSCQRAMG